MAGYSAVPPDDPFAVSRGMFDGLAAELAGPAAAALTTCELEELLGESGREVIRQLLQDHLDLRAAREEQQAREEHAPAAGTDGITRTRLETGHGRMLATLFGTVTVTRCAWRKPGAANFCSADAALSLPAGRHSLSLAKLAALEAARGSFGAAHAAITRRCGNVIPHPADRSRRRPTDPGRHRRRGLAGSSPPGTCHVAVHCRVQPGSSPNGLALSDHPGF